MDGGDDGAGHILLCVPLYSLQVVHSFRHYKQVFMVAELIVIRGEYVACVCVCVWGGRYIRT
jgi:hypothetical protein